MNVINEFGLYRLILRSNKPNAKAFQRWLIHDVLPADPQNWPVRSSSNKSQGRKSKAQYN